MNAHHSPKIEPVVEPMALYIVVYGLLMALLAATVAAASYDLGRGNVVIALVIAVIKALLVILFFMHVRHSSRLTWLFVAAGFCWLSILLTLTMTDYISPPAPARLTRERKSPRPDPLIHPPVARTAHSPKSICSH